MWWINWGGGGGGGGQRVCWPPCQIIGVVGGEGGQRVCWPPCQIIGGGGCPPPCAPPPSSYAYEVPFSQTDGTKFALLFTYAMNKVDLVVLICVDDHVTVVPLKHFMKTLKHINARNKQRNLN